MLETLVPSSSWELFPSFPLLFTLDNFYWSIHFYFWFWNSHSDLLYHFYFPIEIVHLSTHFKIFFLLGYCIKALKSLSCCLVWVGSILACVSWLHVGLCEVRSRSHAHTERWRSNKVSLTKAYIFKNTFFIFTGDMVAHAHMSMALVLSFYLCVGAGVRTQVIRLSKQALYLQTVLN